MFDNYTPLFSEILGKLSKLKTKNQKMEKRNAKHPHRGGNT